VALPGSSGSAAAAAAAAAAVGNPQDQQLLGSYLPAPDSSLTPQQEVQLEALGRCWAKALLEGVHIGMDICPVVFRWGCSQLVKHTPKDPGAVVLMHVLSKIALIRNIA
jgi:hypothetical protein